MIFMVSYEVIGAGCALMARHFLKKADAGRQLLDFAGMHYAVGFKSSNFTGEIRSFLYNKGAKNIPVYMKKIGEEDDGHHHEYVPRRATIMGRQVADQMPQQPRVPQSMDVIKEFGWHQPNVYDDTKGVRYSPTLWRFELDPRPIDIIRLPRTIDDGWSHNPSYLCERSEADVMRLYQRERARNAP